MDHYAESNALLADIILNYRTIISFGNENIDVIVKKYESYLVGPQKEKTKLAHLGGVGFGFT
jgi:ABC-type transport system involved in Fe-S cluster assembly fused permease/ATPase subunit